MAMNLIFRHVFVDVPDRKARIRESCIPVDLTRRWGRKFVAVFDEEVLLAVGSGNIENIRTAPENRRLERDGTTLDRHNGSPPEVRACPSGHQNRKKGLKVVAA